MRPPHLLPPLTRRCAQLGCPEGVACGRDGRVYVASVGASGETPACVSLLAAPPAVAAAPLKPTHGTDGAPLSGQSLPRVRQQRVMPGAISACFALFTL